MGANALNFFNLALKIIKFYFKIIIIQKSNIFIKLFCNRNSQKKLNQLFNVSNFVAFQTYTFDWFELQVISVLKSEY